MSEAVADDLFEPVVHSSVGLRPEICVRIERFSLPSMTATHSSLFAVNRGSCCSGISMQATPLRSIEMLIAGVSAVARKCMVLNLASR